MREHTTRDPFVPVVRCAADLLAVVPHTLGYWPTDSLVLFAAGGGTAGACVRVDLPDEPADEPFAETFVAELAELMGHDTASDRVFAIVYADVPAPPRGPAVPPRVAGVFALVAEAARHADRAVAARWIVAGDRWWPAHDPSDVQDVAGIQDSAVNAALVAGGSSYASGPRQAMDHEYGALPPGTVRDVAHRAVRWLSTGGPAWHHLDRLAGSLRVWQDVLDLVAAGGPAWVPAVLALDDDLLGFLAAGLSDPVLADLLLAVATTADADGVLAAAALWAELCDEDPGADGVAAGPTLAPAPAGSATPPRCPGDAARGECSGPGPVAVPDAGELIRLTRVLAGEWEQTPDWAGLDTLYRVLLALSWLLDPATASTEAVADRTERAAHSAVLAGVLVELAQLNRFRARGSHTAHFVRRATALVPGHPAALRVLRLADARPVPVWARDRSTAWHA